MFSRPKICAALSIPPIPIHHRDCLTLRRVIWSFEVDGGS